VRQQDSTIRNPPGKKLDSMSEVQDDVQAETETTILAHFVTLP